MWIMKTNEKQIWFPAKKYGWGWGFPCAWQGWAVYGVWFVVLTGSAILVAPRSIGLFVAVSLVVNIAFFIVVALKGEKPRWRWGKD
jgi:hypothetical protein